MDRLSIWLREGWRSWQRRYAWWRAKHSKAAIRNAEKLRAGVRYHPRAHRRP